MTAINQVINVNSFFFKQNAANTHNHSQVKTYPRRIEFGNTQYTFEDGLQCLIRKGRRVVRLFDMTDGRTLFRLKYEDDQWTLLGTRSANYSRNHNTNVSVGA